MSNDFVYEGVIDALKHNLERQELNPGKQITTDICYKSSSTVKLSRKRHGVAVVGRTGSAHWNDGDMIKLGEGKIGLVIKFSFDTVVDGEDVGGEKIQNQYEKFQKLSSLPLFTHHTGIYMRPESSNRFRCREYAIDFGQDYEGAARLISEVLDKVYEIPHDGKITCLAEDDEIKSIEIAEEPQEEVEEEKIEYSKWQKIGIGFSIVCLLMFLFKTFSNGGIVSSFFVIGTIAIASSAIFKRKAFNGMLSFVMPILVAFSFFVVLFSEMSKVDEKVDKEMEVLRKGIEQEEKQKATEKEKSDMDVKNKREKVSKSKSIAEEAYASGVHDAGELEYLENAKALIQAGYPKGRIEDMQKQQGRLNYKEKYGEPKNSEEESLMNLYGEKYAEGFMKTMFKN